MNIIYKTLKEQLPLNTEDQELLEKYFIPHFFPAKSLLLKEGLVENYIYFVEEGIVKGYTNIDGKINVQHLVGKNGFIASIESFLNRVPAAENMEAISDCKTYKISHPDFVLLTESVPKWKTYFNSLLQTALACKMDRIKHFQTLSAKQRYLNFLEERSDLANLVPIQTLASYLGIEPPSLSRIRKQMSQ